RDLAALEDRRVAGGGRRRGGWVAGGLARATFGGGKPVDRIQQAPAMTDGTHTEFLQIRAGQMRQHGRVDVVVDERPHIGPETELTEPCFDKFHVRTGNWFGHLKSNSELTANARGTEQHCAETASDQVIR